MENMEDDRHSTRSESPAHAASVSSTEDDVATDQRVGTLYLVRRQQKQKIIPVGVYVKKAGGGTGRARACRCWVTGCRKPALASSYMLRTRLEYQGHCEDKQCQLPHPSVEAVTEVSKNVEDRDEMKAIVTDTNRLYFGEQTAEPSVPQHVSIPPPRSSPRFRAPTRGQVLASKLEGYHDYTRTLVSALVETESQLKNAQQHVLTFQSRDQVLEEKVREMYETQEQLELALAESQEKLQQTELALAESQERDLALAETQEILRNVRRTLAQSEERVAELESELESKHKDELYESFRRWRREERPAKRARSEE